MKSKDIFDLRRFGRYLAFDLRNCSADYGLTIVSIPVLTFGALYVFYVLFWLVFFGQWHSPGVAVRSVFFLFSLIISTIAMPVKCYGRLTEKQYGTLWLGIPASRLEKYISMIFLTVFVAPVLSVLIYVSFDALICLLDPFMSGTVAGALSDIAIVLSELKPEDVEYVQILDFIRNITSPFSYIDDVMILILPFLLGALCFKDGKVIKTFLAIALFGMLTSMVLSPILMKLGLDIIREASNATVHDLDALLPFLDNLKLIDNISDTVMLVMLLVAIYYRIRTLKH